MKQILVLPKSQDLVQHCMGCGKNTSQTIIGIYDYGRIEMSCRECGVRKDIDTPFTSKSMSLYLRQSELERTQDEAILEDNIRTLNNFIEFNKAWDEAIIEDKLKSKNIPRKIFDFITLFIKRRLK